MNIKDKNLLYSQLYFGKELSELEYTDIEAFFLEEKLESDKIEFKGYAENIKGKIMRAIPKRKMISSEQYVEC